MTDNTNIEALAKAEFDAWYRADKDSIIPQGTHENAVQSLMFTAWKASRAALSNAEPVMELIEGEGWEFCESIDPDFLESLPHGTKLFLHPSVPAPQWLPIESAPTSESISFLVLVQSDSNEPLAIQVSNFQGDMYPDCKAGIIDWEDRISGATHWAMLPLTNTGEKDIQSNQSHQSDHQLQSDIDATKGK